LILRTDSKITLEISLSQASSVEAINKTVEEYDFNKMETETHAKMTGVLGKKMTDTPLKEFKPMQIGSPKDGNEHIDSQQMKNGELTIFLRRDQTTLVKISYTRTSSPAPCIKDWYDGQRIKAFEPQVRAMLEGISKAAAGTPSSDKALMTS
jgi:hypothetical protein